MEHQLPARQRLRKGLVILGFISFPITMNYLSPYVIVDGAMQGIVNASLILFGLMFLSSLMLGRAWCGWICPGAGMQEIIEPLNSHRVKGSRLDWIKWLIWIPWISIILWLVVQAGGYKSVDFFHLTESGVSVDTPLKYITYYFVVMLMMGIAALVGRRASCHAICWMAPFMILGRWIRNRFGWPSLQLEANTSACTNCKQCTRDCLMSLDVNAMVQAGQMENSECILCGTCIDHCPSHVIDYAFAAEKKS
jgi:polyferredoxin